MVYKCLDLGMLHSHIVIYFVEIVLPLSEIYRSMKFMPSLVILFTAYKKAIFILKTELFVNSSHRQVKIS